MKHYTQHHGASGATKEFAKKLRYTMTPAEHRFWFMVRNRKFLDLKFRRQHAVGDYIVDFYCHELKLVIELDGGIHDLKKRKNYDAVRERRIEDLGLTILRFRNQEVFSNMERIEEEVKKVILVKKNSLQVNLSRST